MKKIKNLKVYNRIVTLGLVGTTLVSMVGLASCTKKKDEITLTEVVTDEDLKSKEILDEEVKKTTHSIESTFSGISNDIAYNSTLILLLNELVKRNENGKISSEMMSNYKSIIDADGMIGDYNSLIDIAESYMQQNGMISFSAILPESLTTDSMILERIESIIKRIIDNKDDSSIVIGEFNKIYSLFVSGSEIVSNNQKFSVNDLSITTRALANLYARVAAYYSKDYILDEDYKLIDEVTNDQNNKSKIREILSILDNEIEEISKYDINSVFTNKYASVEKLISGVINLPTLTTKNIIDYINLGFLNSDEVAYKDKKNILLEYEDGNVNSALIGIDTITKYNLDNPDKALLYSDLLINEYKATEDGKMDALTLDYIQYTTKKLLEETNESSSFEEIYRNPYFQAIYQYFTKQDCQYAYKDENGELKTQTIVWQNVSEGVNFAIYEVIRYTLSRLPQLEEMNSYSELISSNLQEAIHYIQISIDGECQKIDEKNFTLGFSK